MMKLDEYGIPIVEIPVHHSSWKRKLVMMTLVHVVFPAVMPLVIMKAAMKNSFFPVLSNLRDLYKTISKAHKKPILALPENQNKDLIAQVWTKPSAMPYITNNALEYQKSEGYCGRSTLRNILKSFPNFPNDLIPQASGGPCDPKTWSKLIHDLAEEHHTKMPKIQTRIIPGDIPYANFMEEIKVALNDPSSRIALNYLRPALVGFKTPKILPANFVLSLMSGHFSPIIGMLNESEDSDCLIAVFDVNHTYGGTYLVPSRMLYESVKAHDLMTGRSRALVIIKMENPLNQNGVE